MSTEAYEKLRKCTASVSARVTSRPEIGIILGSGLGGFGEEMEIRETVSYSEIEGFPVSTVKGHSGRYLFGTLEGREVVMMQGRVHYYEGYDMQDVVLPTRLMGMLGIKQLILTNASGGINPALKPGDLVITQGAGDVTLIGPALLAALEETYGADAAADSK